MTVNKKTIRGHMQRANASICVSCYLTVARGHQALQLTGNLFSEKGDWAIATFDFGWNIAFFMRV